MPDVLNCRVAVGFDFRFGCNLLNVYHPYAYAMHMRIKPDSWVNSGEWSVRLPSQLQLTRKTYM